MSIMRNLNSIIINLVLLVLLASRLISISTAADGHVETCAKEVGSLNRSGFPRCFVFGMASAAYQYEGAVDEDGRGKSVWDKYYDQLRESKTEAVHQSWDPSSKAMADSYHRYKEDVAILKDMGVDAYRFSISWSRILPTGTREGGINRKGIDYYNNLIDELIRQGIKPFATLLHFDVPLDLFEQYGGFTNRIIVDEFRDFADICFENFGDRVKHWITINEPWSYSKLGYASEELAPGRCFTERKHGKCNPATEPYQVAHNQLLAHAEAVKLYRGKYQMCQDGKIGITLVSEWREPLTNSPEDQQAAIRDVDFMLGWFLEPLTHGRYPKRMQENVGSRLPTFTEDDVRKLKNSFDFVGINYYTTKYAAANAATPSQPSYLTDSRVVVHPNRSLGMKDLIGEQAGSKWLYVYPKGIYDLLIHIKKEYNNPIIYITENGVSERNEDKMVWQAISDMKRIEYHHKHLCYVKQAIKEGALVRGYFAWSLLDNFEWYAGLTVRFGFYYVDFKHKSKRYPKISALWFKNFLQGDE